MTKKKKNTAARHNREAKKAIVMNTGNKRSTPIIAVVAALAFAAAAGLALLLFPGIIGHGPSTTATDPSSAARAVQNDRIIHAASLFDDGKARHFRFDDPDSGASIAYFILRSTDGVIRAAFDACDVCWPEGKGYVQDGTAMVCRNCGRRFESTLINVVQGGCNPAPLTRSIDGDRVVIRLDDVKQGRRYFNFS